MQRTRHAGGGGSPLAGCVKVMATFAVHVDPTTLHRGAGGSITGALAFRVGDVWFPDAGWTDFAVVVLAWWCRQCAALRAGAPARLDFMDGPQGLVVRPSEGGRAVVERITRSSSNSIPLTGAAVSVGDVVTAVTEAGRRIVAACEARGWDSRDIDELRMWLS